MSKISGRGSTADILATLIRADISLPSPSPFPSILRDVILPFRLLRHAEDTEAEETEPEIPTLRIPRIPSDLRIFLNLTICTEWMCAIWRTTCILTFEWRWVTLMTAEDTLDDLEPEEEIEPSQGRRVRRVVLTDELGHLKL
ncbi:hypothetical protein R1flu_005246 [Riccia fluitans]|uniref:Uncharacterized protein n=1 Tax=Riccia fluitans TaxID=41844 RepID=A0ABD1YSM6_9MARC